MAICAGVRFPCAVLALVVSFFSLRKRGLRPVPHPPFAAFALALRGQVERWGPAGSGMPWITVGGNAVHLFDRRHPP